MGNFFQVIFSKSTNADMQDVALKDQWYGQHSIQHIFKLRFIWRVPLLTILSCLIQTRLCFVLCNHFMAIQEQGTTICVSWQNDLPTNVICIYKALCRLYMNQLTFYLPFWCEVGIKSMPRPLMPWIISSHWIMIIKYKQINIRQESRCSFRVSSDTKRYDASVNEIRYFAYFLS